VPSFQVLPLYGCLPSRCCRYMGAFLPGAAVIWVPSFQVLPLYGCKIATSRTRNQNQGNKQTPTPLNCDLYTIFDPLHKFFPHNITFNIKIIPTYIYSKNLQKFFSYSIYFLKHRKVLQVVKIK